METPGQGIEGPFWQAIPEPSRERLFRVASQPPLSREEEVAIATRIRRTRRRFFRAVFLSDYALNRARELFQQVCSGTMPNAHVGYTSPDDAARKRIVTSLPQTIPALQAIWHANRDAFVTNMDVRLPKADQQERERGHRRRLREGARLVEAASVRPAQVWVIMNALARTVRRMRVLERAIKKGRKGERDSATCAEHEAELRNLVLSTLQTPEKLAKRVKRMQRLYREYDRARRQLHAGTKWLIFKVAEKYHQHFVACGVPFLRVLPECEARLMLAVDKYDPRAGYKFATYAVWWIRATITRALQLSEG